MTGSPALWLSILTAFRLETLSDIRIQSRNAGIEQGPMAGYRTNLSYDKARGGPQSDLLASRIVAKPRGDLRKAPPIVHNVLNTAGKPLDAQFRSTMEHRFQRDFSAVRVHADNQAAQSAQAVQAQAYTVSPHIVFGAGRYDPSSSHGRHLLSHELTHIAQQGPTQWASADLRIDSASSPIEQEADQISTGRAPPFPKQATQPGLLSRSLEGAGIGAGIGGLGLGAAGAGIGLAASHGQKGWGAFGGIVGGLAGLVGGAVIGDLITRDARPMSGDEKTYARNIFRDSVDFEKVIIAKNSALAVGAPARTVKNTISFTDNKFKPNSTDLTDDGSPHDGMHTLIHELVHVWQYQNEGLEYIPSSLVPQAVAGSRTTRNAAYDWRDAAKNNLPWPSWNAEQQAKCIEEYNTALQRLKNDSYPDDGSGARLRDIDTQSLAEPYVDLLRRKIGAPGSHPAPGTAGPHS